MPLGTRTNAFTVLEAATARWPSRPHLTEAHLLIDGVPHSCNASTSPRPMDLIELFGTPLMPEPTLQPEHLPSMCRYTSKRCFNERAVKRDGARHNLCELHRRKANNNQRRLERRRRVQARRGADFLDADDRRGAANLYKSRPSAVIIRLVRRPHANPLEHMSAASMSIEDMERILADNNAGEFMSLAQAPGLFSLDAVMIDAPGSSPDEHTVSVETERDDLLLMAAPSVGNPHAGFMQADGDPLSGMETFGRPMTELLDMPWIPSASMIQPVDWGFASYSQLTASSETTADNAILS